MPDIEVAITAKEGDAAEVSKARQEGVVSAKAGTVRRGFTFEGFLIISVLAVALAGAYESFSEVYAPGRSLLSLAHRYGYLKSYPIIYEPNKGIWHPLGWLGSGMMVVMMLYSVRKRLTLLSSLGSMRKWLSAHMFLGIMGPLLVTLHTTFKFHGIIATSFWCMIVTMVFGILGRYIYVQIPRSITGAELGVQDIDRMVENLNSQLSRYLESKSLQALFSSINTVDEKVKDLNPLGALLFMVKADVENIFKVNHLRRVLKSKFNLHWKIREEIVLLLKKKASLIRRRNLLAASHRLLHYWHVFHVPLAIVMFIIMFLHIAVYYIFRVAL